MQNRASGPRGLAPPQEPDTDICHCATIIISTSFMGGKGKILGVVIGGMIIGIINYGMTALMIQAAIRKS